jgi:CO/xanthine dehydrogenase FAD-binding subunit
MPMDRYQFMIPYTVEEALNILNESTEAKIIAGGTDLLLRMRVKKDNPTILVDISKLGLEYVREEKAQLLIGAMTTLSSITESEMIHRYFPVLADAARAVGGVQTRNVGTIVGNICTGIPSADMAVPLLVLDTKLNIASVEKDQVIPLQEFFICPRQVKLSLGQMVKEISVSYLPEGNWGWAFLKIGKRRAMRISIVNIAVVMSIEPFTGEISDIRIAMGNVAPVPLRLGRLEDFLRRKSFNKELVLEACTALEDEIFPRTSMRATKEYRLAAAKGLLKKALVLSFERATGREFHE